MSRCSNCGQESTTNHICDGLPQESTTGGIPDTSWTQRDQQLVEAAIHYRNLAIKLGATADDMRNKYDRGLCEDRDLGKLPDPELPDGWGVEDLKDLWEMNAELEETIQQDTAEISRLETRLEELEILAKPDAEKDKLAADILRLEQERNVFRYERDFNKRDSDNLYKKLVEAQESILELQEKDSTQIKIKDLEKWIADLQSGMYVNCVYCGHRYGPKDEVPESMADILKAHIEQCPKHPLSEARAQIAELKAAYGRAVQQLTEEESIRWRLEARVAELELK